MSRVGRKPITIPAGVKLSVNDSIINAEGPKGKLSFTHRKEVKVEVIDDGKNILVTRESDERLPKALHGLTRSIVQNMMIGITQGYEKKLEVVGVGYVVSLQGDTLSMRVGFANEIKKKVPTGLKVTCPDQTHIIIQGCDKQQVGQFAAELRSARKPEPYKGKGVRYQGEYIKLKPGKAATK
jgi:large subunit ribosomal protein L6